MRAWQGLFYFADDNRGKSLKITAKAGKTAPYRFSFPFFHNIFVIH